MTTQPCLVDLSDRAKFQLTGPDRVRYLNGQVSNDVTRASTTAAIEACVCNLKGKLDGLITITESSDGETLRIDAPGELRESLFARLSRYIIADDCELEDVTEELALVHSIGEPAGELPGAQWRQSNRFGPDGFDLWLTPGSLEKVLATGGIVASSAIEEIRILHGIPRWGAELTPDVLPAEVGLDKRAVDFQKGCYLGQEVVSRIESVGRVNRVLSLLVCGDPAAQLEAGWGVFSSGEEKPAGQISSVIFSEELGRFAGLAVLKRQFSGPESKLVTGPAHDNMAIGLEVREFKDGGFRRS